MSKVNVNDFKRGLQYLKEEAIKAGKYSQIAQLGWIIPFSMYLSTQCPKKYGGVCRFFWENALTFTNGLDRIPKCKTLSDICYNDNTYLFDWSETPQGHEIWYDTLSKDICKITNCDIYTPLNEICDIIKTKYKL